MLSIPKLIVVLLVICETTACQTENAAITSRFRRQNLSQNVNNRRNSSRVIQTNKTDEDDLIRKIFSVSNSGLVLFNMTHNSSERVTINEPQQDQAFSEKQEFKVQRNPDGKLNIVFNDVFFPQKSSPHRSTTAFEKTTRPNNDPSLLHHKDIYFPDEIESEPKCKEEGKSFCTDVQNYPEDKVEDMLKNQISKFDVLFGDDDITEPLNISQRMSPGEDSLCASVERVIYPKAGESKDLKWLYIINQKNYTQAVKIEECVNADSACMLSEEFPKGYIFSCKQSFIYRQLVALTENGEIIKDVFKMPSCCKCVYRHV